MAMNWFCMFEKRLGRFGGHRTQFGALEDQVKIPGKLKDTLGISENCHFESVGKIKLFRKTLMKTLYSFDMQRPFV